MPVMSGWELLAKLQADPRLASVPTTVVSADSAPQARSVLHKPMDLPNLLGLLEVVAEARPDRQH